MKRHPLVAYLSLVTLISAGFILAMLYIGERGYYLAGIYMFGPAIAAIITRLFFYQHGFSDAQLHIGEGRHYLRYWLITLAIVCLSYSLFTLFDAISWDLSGETFLANMEEQMAITGQDIHDLPEGMTPKKMLLLFFIGGVSVFNIPYIIVGFGEEFGWRGLMFPLLYKIRPWLGFVVGGLIWFTWHLPLALVMPAGEELSWWQVLLNSSVLAIGSICTFTYFAYVFVRGGSIWLAAFVHAVFNNGSRSFAYFASVDNQLLANMALTLTMLIVVAVLYRRGSFAVFAEYFHDSVDITPPAQASSRVDKP